MRERLQRYVRLMLSRTTNLLRDEFCKGGRLALMKFTTLNRTRNSSARPNPQASNIEKDLELRRPIRVGCLTTIVQESVMGFGRGQLLWLIGIPSPIIILLALFMHH